MSDTGSDWSIRISPRATKEIARAPMETQRRIRDAVSGLAVRPWQGDIRKLEGASNEWRLRVGDWRIRFVVSNEERAIIIVRILPRGRACRD